MAVVAWLLLRGDGGTTYKLRFENAGQLVKDDDVQIGGRRIGSVRDIELTQDNIAQITISVQDGYAPLHEGICDRCGGTLYQRDDDKPATVVERLRVYARDTAPLVDFYGAQGKLVGIDATGPVEDVTVRAIDALRSYGG